jgi:hypothetical protein
MADYIDFVVKASSEPKLGSEFVKMMERATPEELTRWFASKGYDTPLEECRIILDGRKATQKKPIRLHTAYTAYTAY